MIDRWADVRLRGLVTGWNDIADAHCKALGDGWVVAEEYLRLHGEALQTFSAAVGSSPPAREQAVLLMGTHGFNLYLGALGLVVRGQFDVAAYLMRGLLDAQAVVLAVGRHEDLAQEFLSGTLKASTARATAVTDLAEAGENALADDLDRIFGDDADAANALSHAGAIHADKLLEGGNGSITPMLGGREDAAEATGLLRAINQQEDRMLGWMKALMTPLEDTWRDSQKSARKRYSDWMTATEGEDQ